MAQRIGGQIHHIAELNLPRVAQLWPLHLQIRKDPFFRLGAHNLLSTWRLEPNLFSLIFLYLDLYLFEW